MKRKMFYIGLISLMMISTMVPLSMLKEPAKADWQQAYQADLVASDIHCTTLPLATNTQEKFEGYVYNDGPDEADVKVKFYFDGALYSSRFIYDLSPNTGDWTSEVSKYWYDDLFPHTVKIKVEVINGGIDYDQSDNVYSDWFKATYYGDI